MSMASSLDRNTALEPESAALRADLLAETPRQWCERHVLGMAYSLRAKRVAEIGDIARGALRRTASVPDRGDLGDHPAGFAGFVRDRSAETVLAAAHRGFYPWAHIGPLKWWSPAQRAVMMLHDVHLPKRLRRTLRTSDFTVDFDRAFEAVLVGCAARRPGRPHLTWITPRIAGIYLDLHDRGHAHSVEVRDAEGQLVGGLFGVAVGPVFSALSMFHTANDASKIGIVSLYHHLEHWGFRAVDHQSLSPWVEQLGAKLKPRADYEHLLERPSPDRAQPGRWSAELSLRDTADWQPAQS